MQQGETVKDHRKQARELAASGLDMLLAVDQTALDLIPAALYVCSAKGEMLRWNARAAELWGRQPAPGETHRSFFASRLFGLDAQPLAPERTPMELVLRTGQSQRDSEVLLEKADGSRIVVLLNIEPLTEGAFVRGAVNCFLDITERKFSEETFQQHWADLDDFFETAAVPMHWTDTDGMIRRVNKAELDLLGYERDEYVGRHLSEFHIDEDATAVILDRLRSGEPLSRMSAHLKARDGTVKTVLISSSGSFRDGKLVSTRFITLDTTAEQARRQLAAIVESSDDAIVSKDLNGVIASWNQGAERLFGYSAREAIGKSITMLIPPDRQDEEPAILERIRRGERVNHFETVRRRKDGSLVSISLTISPVKDGRGEIVGASKIARDITERRRAEERRNLLMRELSHRAKNLLAVVQGIMWQAARYAKDMKTFEADFSERLQGLARSHDLLVHEDWEGAPLSKLIESQLSFIDQSEELTISAEGPDILLTPSAAQNLGLALHELATNAVKHGAFSRRRGQVEIKWTLSGDNGGARLILTWTESGGRSVKEPRRRGFGYAVLDRIVPQALSGTANFTFRPEGLSWRLEAPLSVISDRK
ncbi:MAG: PAS domain S-box protein [Hyphomicrobiales bacterium]